MTVCFTESRTGLAKLLYTYNAKPSQTDTEREGDREIPDNNMKRETDRDTERECRCSSDIREKETEYAA